MTGAHRRGHYAGQTALVLMCMGQPALAQTQTVSQSESSNIRRQQTLQQTLPPATQENVRVTLAVKDSTVAYVIQHLASQAGFLLAYNGNEPIFQKRISVRVKNAKIMEAMTDALKGTGLTAKIASGGKVIVIGSPAADTRKTQTSVETGSLMGKVIDSAKGEGIAGVSVTLQGTRTGAVTDRSGAFVIANVPVGERTFTFKLLGYASATRSVNVEANKPVTVRVVLKEGASMLAGVVTTATGEQRKLEVGNSITTLNVDSIMQTAPVTSVTDLLETRVPGLTVQRTSGSPGDPARLRLRGTSSIYQNNDPIIVVDGVRVYSQQSDPRNQNAGGKLIPNGGSSSAGGGSSYATPSPIDQIDPNSIETIEVLKGPSASALYGSDAANGVIVVTTKRGKAGRTRWDMAANMGQSNIPGKWPEGRWVFATGNTGGSPSLCIGVCRKNGVVDSSFVWQALNDPRYTPLGTGQELSGTTTVSGGNQALQFAFTATGGSTLGVLQLPQVEVERFQREQSRPAPRWMQRPEQLNRWGAAGQVTATMSQNANVAVSVQLNHQLQRRTSMSDSYGTAISQLEGRYIDRSQELTKPLLNNPYERVTSEFTTLTGSTQLRYRPVVWLPLNGTIGTSWQFRNDQNVLGRGLYRTAIDSLGFMRAGNYVAANHTATLNTTIEWIRQVWLAVGLNYSRANTNDLQGGFTSIPVGVTDPSIPLDSTGNRFQRNATSQQTFGWFLEPRLNISSRFFAMPGFRLDNNGLAGSNAKWMGLPKLNFSWIASDEPLFPLKNVVRLFRLRTAFGVAGVQPSAQDRLRLYTPQTLGTTVPQGSELYGETFWLSSLGNTKLRPERGVEFEGGFDTELWNGRFSLDFTHYRKKRIDAIVSNQLSTSLGNGSFRLNIGDILNTGTELSMTAQLLEQQMIGWNVNLNVTRNANRILRLGSEYRVLMNQYVGKRNVTTYYQVGYPMNGIWERPIYGYHDLDGDGHIGSAQEVSIGSDTLVYMGSSDPKYQLNMHSNMTLLRGRLGVSVGLSYVNGVTQRDLKSMPSGDNNNTLWLTSPFALALNGPGVTQGHEAGYWAAVDGGTGYGMIRTTNTLRFQSLSINTDLGPRIARAFRLSRITVALQGDNLGLWSNYQGKDPNVNAFSTGEMTGDFGQIPEPRTWTLRITMGK